VAESFFEDFARAEGTSPFDFLLVSAGTDFQSASSFRNWNRRWLPGSPFQSVHFVPEATCCAALIASHSVGATTPTRFPFTITFVLGNRDLSRGPAEMSLEPNVFGCTTRACSMPGRRTSVTQVSFPVTFDTVTEFGKDLPTTVY
jgi:hypothetical protein